MVTRLLLTLFLVAVLPGTGCAVEEEVGLYKPVELTSGLRQGIERLKREFLQLEDLKIGDGPIAAWGRKVSVDIEVRYVDGTLVYRGPAFAYVGLEGTVLIHNNFNDGMLSLQQDGIVTNRWPWAGRRRMPSLATWSATCRRQGFCKGADPRGTCTLVQRNWKEASLNKVRKETLIVEATLTASCITGFSSIPRFLSWENLPRLRCAPPRAQRSHLACLLIASNPSGRLRARSREQPESLAAPIDHREVHVRFWEGLAVRFRWATQLFSLLSMIQCRASRLAAHSGAFLLLVDGLPADGVF